MFSKNSGSNGGWTGSIGKPPADSAVSNTQPLQTSQSFYSNTTTTTSSQSSIQGTTNIGAFNTQPTTTTTTQTSNVWRDLDDKGVDSPSSVQKTSESYSTTIIANSDTGGSTGVSPERIGAGGTGGGIEPIEPVYYLLCNSIKYNDYGNAYYSTNGEIYNRYSITQVTDICRSGNSTFKCGEQYCKLRGDSGFDDSQIGSKDFDSQESEATFDSSLLGGDIVVVEPPVNTETYLNGEKGGDECVYTDEQIMQMRRDLEKAQQELATVDMKITLKGNECNDIQKATLDRQSANAEGEANCNPIKTDLDEAKLSLKNEQKGTVSYDRKADYVFELQNELKACIRKNTTKTQYRRMFITQMYDSNEYEGDISVFDKNWNKGDELIHDCDD